MMRLNASVPVKFIHSPAIRKDLYFSGLNSGIPIHDTKQPSVSDLAGLEIPFMRGNSTDFPSL